MIPKESESRTEVEPENQQKLPVDSPGRKILRTFLSKNFRIKMTDGRTLIGLFLCTDADANIILGMCSEFREEEERTLGLVIVPKKHIVQIEVDTAGDNPVFWKSENDVDYIL